MDRGLAKCLLFAVFLVDGQNILDVARLVMPSVVMATPANRYPTPEPTSPHQFELRRTDHRLFEADHTRWQDYYCVSFITGLIRCRIVARWWDYTTVRLNEGQQMSADHAARIDSSTYRPTLSYKLLSTTKASRKIGGTIKEIAGHDLGRRNSASSFLLLTGSAPRIWWHITNDAG
jgi:hypothetical protein